MEVPRGSRRMPEIEEFPVVGQREWHAKQAGHAAQQPRKGGFFSRLSAMGRKSAPSHGGMPDDENDFDDNGSNAQSSAYGSRGRRR